MFDSLHKGEPLDLTSTVRKKPTNEYIPRVQPPWLKFDRKVLRFYGYFQEHVVESSLENYRLRKCAIYYYLSDNTIHVTEPRVENSGIPQGIFIKRSRIPVRMGFPEPYFQWYDLALGQNVTFFERTFRVCACDEFTREFFEYMGQPLGTPEEMPKDAFDRYIEKKDLTINPPDTREYKEYFEVKEGGGHPNGGLDKYLHNDRQVLSFKAVWNDTSLEGGVMDYVVNFFLADDTVEVKEMRKVNSGRDPFPLLLRRMKLPKEPIMTHYPGMTLKKEEYYRPADFQCGNIVRIYARDCLIYDCDEFTRGWFRAKLGIEQVPHAMQAEPRRDTPAVIPPYNGYGTEEDSMGSIYYLQPKPPKKDMIKMFTCEIVLRFEARLISSVKDDANKRFVVTFFNADDTITVAQPPERNSGIWGGKFLERMKHKRPGSEHYLNELDFQIGAVVRLGAYDFQLVRADEFTSNYMSENPAKFPESNLAEIKARIQKAAAGKGVQAFLPELVQRLDPKKTGYTSFDSLKQGLGDMGVPLTWQECHRLAREGNVGPGWKICMKQLWTLFGGR